MKNFIRTASEVNGLTYSDYGWWEKWNDDKFLLQIFSEIDGNTVVDEPRTYNLAELMRHAGRVEGQVAELGVFRGGTARLAAQVLSHKTIHLFDTFEGLPKPDPSKDMMKEGELKADLEQVEKFLSDLNNVKIHPGLFPETAADLHDEKFCFVHVDADIYQSVKDACEFFYPRLNKGGIMVFDDYGFYGTHGAKIAVDEFLTDKEEYPIYLVSHHCFIIKI